MSLSTSPEDPPEFYATILAHMADTVWMTDDGGCFTWVCPNALELLGYTQAELMAKGHLRHLFSHWSEDQLPALRREQRNLETYLYDKAGDRHDLLINVQAVTIGPSRWLYTCRDISARKRLELALNQVNQHLETQVQQHSQELAVFQRAVDAAAIMVITDAAGVITTVNDRFCEISGYSREELVGQTHRLIKADYHPPEFFKTMWDTITQGRIWRAEVCNRHKDGHLYWMDTAISPFLDAVGKPVQYLAIRFDITQRKQIELALRNNLQMLTAISRAQTQFISLADRLTIFEGLLNTLLDITDSEYGFIGEVLFRADGSAYMEDSLMKIRGVPYLKTHSITNIAWDDITQRFYEENYEQGMEFTNMNTLFGAVIMTGQPVIANSPATDPRRGGVPSGHPPLLAFLGLPFYEGDRLMGMVGMANRPGGYSQEMVEALQPFLVTCSILVEGYRLDRQRRETEARLQQTNEELARATRLKDEFLASMSHELRTPLNAILGMAEGMRNQTFGAVTEAQTRALATIERRGHHLLDLINDILDLAKIESGQISLDMRVAALGPICLTSRTFVRQQAQQKPITLDLDVPAELPLVRMDERRLCQALINLLSNAIKFTPPGGSVTLSVGYHPVIPPALQSATRHTILAPPSIESSAPTAASDPTPPHHRYLYLSVADTGIGIDVANMPMLSQAFIQIDSALDRQYQGTGLGLALVKRIMALHGGSLQVVSQPEVGSCFILGLPLEADFSASDPDLPSTHPIPTADHRLMSRPAVLLVAEQRAQISTIETYLKAKRFPLRVANNTPDALALAEADPPLIWVIDAQLPDLASLALIQHLRQDPRLGQCAILVLAPGPADAIQETYRTAGADLCLGQPLSMQKLAATIEQLGETDPEEPSPDS
ncbi:MAG: PAS domain S-box protein [Leptolyngbya sp.]|nr:PAS domain S-box protein [Leptolyngbya sp.]